MDIGWQDIAVVCVVLGAIAYVIRRVRRAGKAKSCAGCAACPNCLSQPDVEPLISIDPPRRSSPRPED